MGEQTHPARPRHGKAAAGELIEIKTLISHEMESGQRKFQGEVIPRKISTVHRELQRKPVFASDWQPGDFGQHLPGFFFRRQNRASSPHQEG